MTSNDETDLLLPLYRGIEEAQRFATFLDRLRRRTGARHVTLALDNEASDAVTALILPAGSTIAQRFRPFRAYSLEELAEFDDLTAGRHVELRETHDIADARGVRIPVSDDRHAWLVVARQNSCSAADSALISSLAPYVKSVLDVWHGIQRERATAHLSALGLERVGAGWLLFDGDARILAIESELRDRFQGLTGVRPTQGERLRAILPPAERHLADMAGRYANSGSQDLAQVMLTAAPRCEAVLCPVDPESHIARQFPTAAMLALCRIEREGSKDRATVFAGLHDLPRREAELAISLADGLSINEAAQAMGLTVETARNYSKRLYSKLDVTGQAQLVRLVHRSSAVLA